jgi:hypothetical protein
VLAWLRQQVPQAEQAALLEQLQEVVADRLLQQLLLAWLAPGDGGGGSGGAEPMAVDGQQQGEQQGQQQGEQKDQENRRQDCCAPPAASVLHKTGVAPCSGGGGHPCKGQDEFVCCREQGGAAPPCSGAFGEISSAGEICRYDQDLEEAGICPGGRPPLRVRHAASMLVCPGQGCLPAGSRRLNPPIAQPLLPLTLPAPPHKSL